MSEQWLPSASDQEERLPIEEDVARAYIDGRNDGRRDERVRIRRELFEAWPTIVGYPQPDKMAKGPSGRFYAALDRIAPEGKE